MMMMMGLSHWFFPLGVSSLV